ncbi:MAG: hypothetical protein P8J37_16155 [Fuerstiella sp.]|nr:hypothetical protein [Fuerstiella sp.]
MAYRPSIAVAHLMTATLVAAVSVQADERSAPSPPIIVTVTLVDDSTVTSVPDAATDDQFLALRSSAPGILLRRFVPWQHIVKAHVGKQVFTSDALKILLKKTKLDHGDLVLADRNHSLPAASNTEAGEVPGAAGPAVAPVTEYQRQANTRRHRVATLEFRATAANWDRDVAFDGIRVVVRPLNAFGDVIPVDGYITLKLFGQKYLPVGSVRHNRQTDVFPALEKWSHKVRKQDFGLRGAVYQFPYHLTNPELVDDLSSIGLTYASLSVPGQGVFRASDGLTALRDFSPSRESHERVTGTRFLPAENVPGSH